MGLDFVRSNNTKCPSFLLCGLMVMCVFLLCNWWSLSSQNFELLKQIDNLAEQLRVNGDELGKCSQQQILLDEKLKDSQTKFVQQQIKIEQIKETEDDVKENYEKLQEELNNVKKKYDSVEKKLNLCIAEKDSIQRLTESRVQDLETLRLEKKQLQAEIDVKDKKIKEFETKLSGTRIFHPNGNAPPIIKEMHTRITKNKEKIKLKSENSKLNAIDQNNSDVVQEPDDVKNDGDASLIPLENEDPREQAMKA